MRGRWKAASSRTLRPYRPRYSEPSASTAPYGPTEAATHTSWPAASAARAARATLRCSRAVVAARSWPWAAKASKPTW